MYDYMQRMGWQQPMSLTRVTGIDGARAYQMPPNSTAALFDGGQDLMYIKSTDGAGFPTIRIFAFRPVEETPESGYATKADLQALREELMGNGKQSIPRKTKGEQSE